MQTGPGRFTPRTRTHLPFCVYYTQRHLPYAFRHIHWPGTLLPFPPTRRCWHRTIPAFMCGYSGSPRCSVYPAISSYRYRPPFHAVRGSHQPTLPAVTFSFQHFAGMAATLPLPGDMPGLWLFFSYTSCGFYTPHDALQPHMLFCSSSPRIAIPA